MFGGATLLREAPVNFFMKNSFNSTFCRKFHRFTLKFDENLSEFEPEFRQNATHFPETGKISENLAIGSWKNPILGILEKIQ